MSSQIGLGKAEKVSEKKLSFQSFLLDPESRIPMKMAKKIKKMKKLRKHHSSFNSSQIRLGKAEKVSKNKIYRSDPSYPT